MITVRLVLNRGDNMTSTIEIGTFKLIRDGEGMDFSIQNVCVNCGWHGSMHYAHNDYQHSNCSDERKAHKCNIE